MKNWTKTLKKSLLVFLSAISFGMINPAQYQAWYEDSQHKDEKTAPFSNTDISEGAKTEDVIDRTSFISNTLQQAKEQSLLKFGERISPVIQDEFYEVVLPGMEQALSEFSYEYPEEKLSDLTISEKPSGGIGEKIFHIYDSNTKEDVIRFHVRRENPPGEGHWFHFHYHTYKDGFEGHHSIARIYWSHNTPPRWLS